MVAPIHAVDEVGFIAGRQMDVVVLPKATGAAIAKGDVLIQDEADAGKFKTAPAGATVGKFAVAVKLAEAADTQVEAVSSGFVTVRASGGIDPGRLVGVSGTEAGQVSAITAGGTTTSLAVVGSYEGKVGANSRNGMPIPAAVDNDVVIIDLNRRTN